MIHTVEVDAAAIKDRGSFYTKFSEAFGFPDVWGRNGDAWIDCMSRLDEDFSKVRVAKGDLVLLHVVNGGALKTSAPEILSDLFEMVAFVNYRRIEIGQHPILILSCYA
jgi:hypothetical protein